jgi:hypothetical protein
MEALPVIRNDTVALPGARDLRARIGWICHGLRIAAVIWIGWNFVMSIALWRDQVTMRESLGRWLGADLSAIPDLRYDTAFALVIIDCGVGASVAYCIWHLAGCYLAGRVFTIDAAVWLRRTGIAGMLAVLADVMTRVAIASILTGQFRAMPAHGSLLLPQDLMHVIFAMFVFALASIFSVAAEMAEDHAQII